MLIGWIAQVILGMGTRPNGQSLAAGLIGSFVGGLLGSLLAGDGIAFRASGIIGSLVGAIIVLLIWNAYTAVAAKEDGRLQEGPPLGQSAEARPSRREVLVSEDLIHDLADSGGAVFTPWAEAVERESPQSRGCVERGRLCEGQSESMKTGAGSRRTGAHRRPSERRLLLPSHLRPRRAAESDAKAWPW